MENRLNSGQIHATSHPSMMLNCRNPSTVRDGRNATTQISSLHLETSRTCVRSQPWTISLSLHNPICVSAHPVMVPQTIPVRRRFNFMKADWNGYTAELDKLIEDVEPIPANYKCFVDSVRAVSRRHIPRGCRTEYVPRLTEESKSLYEANKCKYSSSPFDDGTIESGNTLINKITKKKRKRWAEVNTSTNMTHNCCKAWKTMRKLSKDPTTSNPPCLVRANQVAHQLLVNGRGTMPSKPKRPVLHPATEGDYPMVYPFSEDEYRKGVAIPKNYKSSGRDDVLVEQLKNLGPKAHRWLLTMLNKCFMENKIPTLWRQSKIIAILKPGKDSTIPKSYRPISLLCHTYTLYKRRLLNLIQHIEDGYQENMITGTAFVELQIAHTEHQDEGSYPQQPSQEIS